MILARDLKLGPEKSVFGAQRTLRVTERKLEVRVEIKDAKVSQDSSDSYSFDVLKVTLSVENF
jgi:hypothetical protein